MNFMFTAFRHFFYVFSIIFTDPRVAYWCKKELTYVHTLPILAFKQPRRAGLLRVDFDLVFTIPKMKDA